MEHSWGPSYNVDLFLFDTAGYCEGRKAGLKRLCFPDPDRGIFSLSVWLLPSRSPGLPVGQVTCHSSSPYSPELAVFTDV